MSYYTNSCSMNDVNRFLHDYRHGQGSYDSMSNSMYGSLVNSTNSYSYSGSNGSSSSSRRDWCNTPYNSNGNYYSSSIFTK